LRRDLDDPDHIRGLRLLSPREHNRELNPYRRRLMAALNRPKGVSGIKLGASVIPPEKEFEHFLITGSPGSGKSTLIRQMLKQIQARGEAVIVLDVEAESTMEFYDESRGEVILNPLDARCPFWSPWLEFHEETFAMDRKAMVASPVRNLPRTATEEFFFRSGRTLLKCLCEVIIDREPSAINDFLSLMREELHPSTIYHLLRRGKLPAFKVGSDCASAAKPSTAGASPS
jgi:hypothetical protein